MATNEPPTSAHIERLQRRRTRLAMVQGAFFLIWQANFFVASPHMEVVRTVDRVRVISYLIWAVLLLLFLATGGGFLYSPEVRAVLNDESTIEHRRKAQTAGFWAAMLAAVAAYAAALFESYPPVYAVHAVLTAGLSVALLVFARLERRAQDG